MKQPDRPPPLYNPGRFAIEIDGIVEASFTEVSGFQSETEIFEWEEGGLNTNKWRLAGRTKYANLVLKRGFSSLKLWDWYQTVVNLKPVRHNLSIFLYSYEDKGAEMVRWTVNRALPVKWVGPTFKAGATEVALETLELAHHGIELVTK